MLLPEALRRRHVMFTASQYTIQKSKARADNHDSAVPARGLKWTGRGSQNIVPTACTPEQELAVLWLSDPAFPTPTDVHRVITVENLRSALQACLRQSYTLAIEPVTTHAGTAAIIQDASGTRLCVLEKTGARTSGQPEAEEIKRNVGNYLGQLSKEGFGVV
jgi:hypothetical protein